jgi:phosphatidylglycerophosphatase A
MAQRTKRDRIILFIAQGGYSGRVPKAPGTAGTAVGVLVFLALGGAAPAGYGLALAAVIGIGTWTAGEADRILGTKDGQSIVIDEIAGFLVAMFLVPFTWWGLAAVFALFRFFDILKPWPADRLQSVPGGPGVMLDDIIAGIYANAVFRLALVNFGL